jgi:hypothetical protein
MTTNQSHIAGLELALDKLALSNSDCRDLQDLIAQAKAAPEPVQGEAVEVVAVVDEADEGFFADLRDVPGVGCTVRRGDKLMTVAQHTRIMAAARPDAELVALLSEMRRGIECTSLHHKRSEQHGYDDPCKVLARIDAKLAELRKGEA